MRSALGWLVAVATLFGLWLLLVGSLALPEVVGGALAAAVAATGYHVVRSRDDLTFAVRPGWLALLLRRLPLHTLADCGRVLGALWLRATGKPVRGTIERIPFDPGEPDDPYAAGRRALVVAGTSLAPNAVAVRIDGQDLIVHQLLPTGSTPSDRQWPL